MKSRRSFFIKLLIAAGACLLADIGAGKLLRHFYSGINHGEQGRMNYAIDSSREDIIILGSSRASHHYVSAMMEERLHLSCYNAGKDKQGILYSLAMMKMLVARRPPAYIILDFNPYAFATFEQGLDILSVLLPYYRQHPEIRPILNKRSQWEPVKTLSALYCYNSLPLQIAFNKVSAGRDAGAVQGYVPLNRSWNNSADTMLLLRSLSAPADSLLVNAFEEMVQLAAANGCKLIVVASPFFITMPTVLPTIEKCRQICTRQRVPFFDYNSLSPFVTNTSLFADALHLNHTGATRFTDQLCTDLLSAGIIQKPSAAAPK